MNWESRYLPPEPNIWQGRNDEAKDSCIYQYIKLVNLQDEEPKKTAPVTFALIGFKCDEGVHRDLGRTGAAEAPAAIRQRLAKLPLQKTGIDIYDAGNIVCADHDLEASQSALAETVALFLKKGICPIVIGGGHEVAWGQYMAIEQVYSNEKKLGIINCDAHFDMQPLQPSMNGSSKTTFWQIAQAHKSNHRHFDYNCIGIQHAGNVRQSFEISKQHKVNVILADDLHQGLQEKCFDFVDRVIDENEIIYFSLSLDVFSPAYAPGVSTIQPLGLNPWQIIPLLRQAAASCKVISYDISEYVPRCDIDHRTAKLAAVLIYEIIHHHNEPSHQR